jgi:hypothetical protein
MAQWFTARRPGSGLAEFGIVSRIAEISAIHRPHGTFGADGRWDGKAKSWSADSRIPPASRLGQNIKFINDPRAPSALTAAAMDRKEVSSCRQ